MIESINLNGGGGGGDDEKAKISANDTTAGYLNGKLVAGTGITLTENNNGADETLTIATTIVDTNDAAKVSSNDTTAGFLNGKLVAGTGITFTENNNGANETLTIASSVTDTNDAAKVSSNDTTAGYLNGKLVAGTNVTFTEGNDGGNETLTIAAAGGVTGFTGSQNTSSPNNTVNASRLLVDASSTNADFVAQPKGTGALLAQLPNGAATGGNKRGANAVDLQTSRLGSSQVASGTTSFAAGANNMATGTSSVAIGDSNIASATGAVAMGYASTGSGVASVALGNAPIATGVGSFAVGSASQADGDFSSSIGINGLASRYGQLAHASGNFSSKGDAQREEYVLRRTTTDATATELTCDGQAAGAATRMSITTDSAYVFHAFIVGRATAANDNSAGYKIEGVIDNNAGTTAFVGTPTVTVLGEDTAGWDVVAEADNTNDALVIKVTGAAATTIRWVAAVRLVKVTG